MECKFCNATLPEDAMFCSVCGKALDEKQRCPVCNEPVKVENSVFCSSCGARLDGKNQCECGFVYEGNFCPMCGKPSRKVTKTQKLDRPKNAQPAWKRALAISSVGVGLLAVLSSLIFVFFLGWQPEIDGDKDGVGYIIDQIGAIPKGYTLFYYFGDVYKDLSLQLSALESYSAGYEVAHTLLCVFATIASALAIILTVVFAVIAIVKSVRYFADNTRPSPLKYCLATAFSYFIGVIAFIFTVSQSLELERQEIEIELSYILNDATKAGIILGAILAVIAIGLKFASNYDKLFKKESLLDTIVALVKITLLTIACALVVFSVTDSTVLPVNTKSDIELTSKSNIFTFVVSLFQAHNVLPKTEPFDNELISCTVLSAISFVLTIAFLVFAVLCVVNSLDKLDESNGKSGLWIDITLASIALVTLVITIIGCAQIESLVLDIYEFSEQTALFEVNYSCGRIIALAVLTLLSFGLGVANKALKSKR